MRALERGAPCCTCSASRPQHSRQPCALPLHSSGGNHSLRRLALHLPPPRRSVTMALLPPPEPRQALAGVDAPPSTSVSVPALAEPALGPPLAVPRDGFKVVRAAVYHSGPDPVPVFTALQGLFPDVYASNTGAKRACRRREICVDGQAASTSTQVTSLTVHYEDEHMAVVYKPSGMHIAKGVDSVASCIKYCLLPSREHDTLNHPRPAHRLDAATCGLVVCGKTRRALAALSAQFKERSMDKWYHAILKGSVGGEGSSGEIHAPISGKPSSTHYTVLKETPSATWGTLSTVRLKLMTGRKHQLRRHCAERLYRGMLGDPKYRATKPPTDTTTTPHTPDTQAPATPATNAAHSSQTDAPVSEDTVLQGHTDTHSAHHINADQNVVDEQCEAECEGECDESDDEAMECESETSEMGQDTHTHTSAAEGGTSEAGKGQTNGVQGGGGRRADFLCDGQRALMCLCALEIRLAHPVTGEAIHVCVPEPDFFETYRQVEAAGAAQAR